VVTDTSTQTLTNKTLTSPVIAGTPTGVGVLTSGTAVASTSGTSIDFTSIPSWVKRITVMLNGVSTNGTSPLLIQIGDSGGIENTSYVSSANYSTGTSDSSAGFIILYAIVASSLNHGGAIILSNLSGNTWVSNGNMTDTGGRNSSSAGYKTLSDVLDRIRITTVNGTDTFDAGSINILYE
jgi:hypothetical protein